MGKGSIFMLHSKENMEFSCRFCYLAFVERAKSKDIPGQKQSTKKDLGKNTKIN